MKKSCNHAVEHMEAAFEVLSDKNIDVVRVDYSPGMIASLGQTSAQEPHSMQVSGSMW